MDDLLLHTVDEKEDGLRLDVLLAGFPDVASRSAAVRCIEAGEVRVDGAPARKRTIVRMGSKISYPFVASPSAPLSLIPERIPLDIRYEDEQLIVLSKQAGLVCHPSPGHEQGTLANALLAHCGSGHLGMLQGDKRPGIVHRLDRDTTGLMLAAKTDEAQAALQDAIRLREVDRRYLALVHGEIVPDTGMVDAPIVRSNRDRLRMTVSDDPGARGAITTFTVLERFEASSHDEGYTLIECKLYTGRTHQIRVHMASIGHPCVGDPLYGLRSRRRSGRSSASADLRLNRQFLHSYRLSFNHPGTGERLSFTDCPPWDLQEVLDALEGRLTSRTAAGEGTLALLAELSSDGLLESAGRSAFDDIATIGGQVYPA